MYIEREGVARSRESEGFPGENVCGVVVANEGGGRAGMRMEGGRIWNLR